MTSFLVRVFTICYLDSFVLKNGENSRPSKKQKLTKLVKDKRQNWVTKFQIWTEED